MSTQFCEWHFMLWHEFFIFLWWIYTINEIGAFYEKTHFNHADRSINLALWSLPLKNKLMWAQKWSCNEQYALRIDFGLLEFTETSTSGDVTFNTLALKWCRITCIRTSRKLSSRCRTSIKQPHTKSNLPVHIKSGEFNSFIKPIINHKNQQLVAILTVKYSNLWTII